MLETLPHLREFVIFLVSAVVVLPLFHRLRLSPVLGYLVLGICVGPYGLGLIVDDIGVLRYAVISDVEGVRALADLGIVFLLFTIGLEFSLERLWRLRHL